ncbi:MAG: vitamin B12-dependent ribonucleotide reductase [Dehalococcoidales bacterium]|nr:vitamin B12-dependent ribonucleotide reductase [Dehalococcoidales bacterium]
MNINRNDITRIVFNESSAMGIANREIMDKVTSIVISKIESPAPTFPGMEDLISPDAAFQTSMGEAEVTAMVREELTLAQLEKNATPTLDMFETTTTEEPQPEPIIEPVVEIKTEPEKPKTKKAPKIKIELNETAKKVLAKRYLKKDKDGNPIEDVSDMLHRVAKVVASAETNYDKNADLQEWEDRYYSMIASLDFLPNSPTLMNAGRELGQLSACFVLPVEDSMEEIFETVKNTALIHKSGGGTGFSFSHLRPETDRVGTTGGVASGPVSFMRVFDIATDVIKQGGTRRGANMAILSVDHPDILKFITVKQDMVSLTNFNISVAITDDFMNALKNDENYALINPHTKEKVGEENARKVFDLMVNQAWLTGDPGVIFIDRINRDNPNPNIGRIESTNPCGEQPLLPYESCNLGSINLSHMLNKTTNGYEVDWDKLEATIRLATRFLDNIIDINRFPLDKIAERTRSTRKIGLGIMGFADMLMLLGIPYNSDDAISLAEKIMGFVTKISHEVSNALGKERGLFPAYEGSIFDNTTKETRRNSTCTTIAPTGTLSIIAGCSSGIEPLFALCFTRNIMDNQKFIEVNPVFSAIAKENGFYSDELMEKLANGEHIADMEEVPEKFRKLFVTAHDISIDWHVKMQAAFQRHTDNAVSKTINFPHESTPKDVEKAYLMAYNEGLKGITIYRDGCRDTQVLSTGKKEEKKESPTVESAPVKRAPRTRSKITTGYTERVMTGCGYIYVTVNYDENGICEVFSHLGKTGGCAAAQLEASCRLISLALRSGIKVNEAVKQLKGIRCPSVAWDNGKSILSCADAIAGVLERVTAIMENKTLEEVRVAPSPSEEKKIDPNLPVKNVAGQCPECGSLLVFQEGCLICPGCGFSRCG